MKSSLYHAAVMKDNHLSISLLVLKVVLVCNEMFVLCPPPFQPGKIKDT